MPLARKSGWLVALLIAVTLTLSACDGDTAVPAAQVTPNGKITASLTLKSTFTFKPVKTGDNPTEPLAVISSDGQYVAGGRYGRTITLWEAATGKELGTIDEKYDITSFKFLADGKTLVTSGGGIKLWEVPSLKLIGTLKDYISSIYNLWVSPDGNYIAGNGFSDIYLWNRNTGLIINTFAGKSPNLPVAAFSPDSKFLAATTKEGSVIWDLAKNSAAITLNDSAKIRAFAFSPDSKTLAVMTDLGTTGLIDIASGKLLGNHRIWGKQLYFGANNQTLININAQLSIWNIAGDKQLIGTNAEQSKGMNKGEVTADGKLIVTSHDDGTAKLWEASY